MEKRIQLYLPELQTSVDILLHYKNIKTIRLKVYPSGQVRLSVPGYMLKQDIQDFLISNRDWLTKRLCQYSTAPPGSCIDEIFDGADILILGQPVKVHVQIGTKPKVSYQRDGFYIQVPQTGSDMNSFQTVLEKWWRQQCRDLFSARVDRWYPVIQAHGIPKPAMQVRKMKTRWGSCSFKKGSIRLNYYLYQAPLSCIDYVVLHELAHFLHQRHDCSFYRFLTTHMPDWQERKRQLDFEISSLLP